ncbi:MAG: endonuclease/exonuclease/phosphatase family protein [Myxococcales bacterium]|nr:endonuclease/exonuclease/phosphatase family protein [Myxococcales bacterium]
MRACAFFLLFLGGLSTFTACGDDSGSSTGAGGSGASGVGGQGGEGGQVVSGEPLKILNWNTRNFVNDLNDSTVADEFIKSTAEYQAQLTAVAAAITELDPDVAVLAEVENQAVLDDLMAELGPEWVDSSLIESADPRGIDIAAVSKLPFSDVVSHQDDEFVVEGTNAPTYTFARDAVEYHVTFRGQDIVLIGVHFRSKGPPDDPNKRLAEAQRSRAIADELTAADSSLGVIILGDFNDLPGSAPFKAVEGAAPDKFVDAASYVAEADRWTFDFQGNLELIDHQMANVLMQQHLDTKAVVIRHGLGAEASDHAPMMATYRFE